MPKPMKKTNEPLPPADDLRLVDPDMAVAEEENGLRPNSLREFIGQESLKDSLSITLKAAQKRGESLEHMLFSGPPGLGKTTLACILAKEMGVNLKIVSAPAIERAGDLAGYLTNLQPHDLLFIDEIHRLSRTVEEILYPAMEDQQLDILVGKGPTARFIRLTLPPFTLVGATTRMGQVAAPLRDRFGVAFRMEFYLPEELARIVARSAGVLGVPIDPEGCLEIARRSRGTPRIANRLLKRVRDYAQVRAEGRVDRALADTALNLLEVDGLGLDRMDRRILSGIIGKFSGGPVGVETLAMSVGEESETLEDVYEPYLVQIGFLQRTPSGRKATPAAYRHLGLTAPEGPPQSKLFE